MHEVGMMQNVLTTAIERAKQEGTGAYSPGSNASRESIWGSTRFFATSF